MRKKLVLTFIVALILSSVLTMAGGVGDNMAVSTNMAVDNVTQNSITLHAWYNSDSGTLCNKAEFYCDDVLFATVLAGGQNNWTTDQVTKASLSPGTQYKFSVRFYLHPYNGTWINSAGTSWGTSGYSHTDYYTTDQVNPPSAITGLTGTPDLTSMYLSWSGGTGATKYEIYVDGSFVDQTTDKHFNVTGLQSGTSYLFEVVAVNSGGTTQASITRTTLSPDPPSSITSLSATPGYTNMSLSWTGGSGATKFEIYVDESYVDQTANSSYNVINLSEGTTYTFEVVAVNDYGTTSRSTSATTLAHRPTNFTGFQNLNASGGAVNVTATEWWALCNKVNDFRAYKNLPNVNFTFPTAGQTLISAAIYNEVRNALNAMSAYFTNGTSIPAAKVSNVDDINPSDFTRLMDALNSIL